METQSIIQEGKSGLFKSSLAERQDRTFFAREGVDPLTHAFDKKITVHAGFGGHPVPEKEQADLLGQLLARPRRKQSSVYIHVPFCESHCLYCGFYNQAYRAGESSVYTEALLHEIQIWSRWAAMQAGPVDAVYIGGGTPTALDGPDLFRLLDTVRRLFPLTNDCEITVEGRIHNFGLDKMMACLDGGANRFSIGVQTFHTELRRSMNRMTDRNTVFQSLARLKDLGRAVVVIDLIYGFPEQTMEMWRRDLDDFLALGLDGVDFYQLNVFGNSPLGRAIEKGLSPPALDLPQQARLFEAAVNIMEKARYRRLSMSHWGRTTRERNLYNHLMKGPSECLAFGPGAGGCLKGHYYFVANDYRPWLAGVDNGEKPISILTAPHPLAELDKTIAAAFDLGRLDLGRLDAYCRQPARRILDPLLEQWQQAALITLNDEWVEPTLAGQFWHVNLAQLMIEYLHQNIA